MATIAERPEFKVVGTRPIRHDGTDKVTGRAKYGADVLMPGLLHGKVLRSPHAHARIRKMDTSKAEAHPGVRAVLTWKDLPNPPEGNISLGEGIQLLHTYMSENTLAREKVLYKGHPVAAVAATSPHVAEEALSLVQVEYELLPPILDGREAMKEEAPLLHDDLTTKELGQDTGKLSNVASHNQVSQGNLEKGFQEADIIVEREFRTASVHQGYIEPQNSTALWDADEHITLWSSTQGSFGIRRQLSDFLQIPVSKITVMPVEVGGGFGGKVSIYMEPVAALLSRKAGHHPVKIVMTRAEVFEGTGPTSGSYIWVKMGATRDGQITAVQSYLAYEAGAYPGSPVGGAVRTMLAPYHIENVQIDSYDIVVNRPKTGAYRAPGLSNASFAVETVVDEICEQIGMDPLDFHLKNGIKEGDRRADGTLIGKIGNLETIQAIKDSPHNKTPLKGKYQGRGVASGGWHTGGMDSSCSLSVNPDGTVGLVMGSVDIGGTRAAIAMQAAEVLGLRAEDIQPWVVNTDSVGYTRMTVGSRTAFATGWAAYEAAQDVARQMRERAARIWEVAPEDVEFTDGVFHHKSDPELRLTFRELAGQLLNTGGPIAASATASPQGVGDTYVTHVVDVEVDPETGKVDILRYTAAQDVGQAIHPSYVEGQIQGGAVQGIGWALNEEYVYNDQGVMTNATFLDYRMPTTLDVPMIDTILVQVPNPAHPYGARGVGEPPIVPPLAAIANAIYRALGVRLNKLPMSPSHILEALWEKAEGAQPRP